MNEFLLALGVDSGIVCAVGAGGKKSLLYAIAQHAPGRVALTSTVHTTPYPAHLIAQVIVDEEAGLLARMPKFTPTTRLAYAQPSSKANRLAGVSSEIIHSIHHAGHFDLTLVKADGARGRGIKAPKPGEPVIANAANQVFAVVSIATLHKTLVAENVHRPEYLAAMLGVPLGTHLTPKHFVTLLTHPQGALQAVGNARLCIVINQIHNAEQKQIAQTIAEDILERCTKIERVVLTCLSPTPQVVDLIPSRAAK